MSLLSWLNPLENNKRAQEAGKVAYDAAHDYLYPEVKEVCKDTDTLCQLTKDGLGMANPYHLPEFMQNMLGWIKDNMGISPQTTSTTIAVGTGALAVGAIGVGCYKLHKALKKMSRILPEDLYEAFHNDADTMEAFARLYKEDRPAFDRLMANPEIAKEYAAKPVKEGNQRLIVKLVNGGTPEEREQCITASIERKQKQALAKEAATKVIEGPKAQ